MTDRDRSERTPAVEETESFTEQRGALEDEPKPDLLEDDAPVVTDHAAKRWTER